MAVLDIEKIQKLIEVMVTNDLVEVSLRDGDVEINLRRPNPAGCGAPAAVAVSGTSPAASNPVAGTPALPESSAETKDGEFIEIKSPMVGTFYTASDPESLPLVQPGSKVLPSTVVCLLEAMKVFSEIKAEVTGTIERIFVKNAEAVEYGQPLFLVRVA
jgi:acetyl-CoA carboxylase biotin carboxyl carrier protein